MDVLIDDLSALCCGNGRYFHLVDHALEVLQTGISAHGDCHGAGDLHAVVLFRVVACRDLHGGIGLEIDGCEVDHRGGGKTYVPDVHAGVGDSAAEEVEDLGAGETHVTSHDDIFARKELRKEESYLVDCFLVEIPVVDAADVIGFECTHITLLYYLFAFD